LSRQIKGPSVSAIRSRSALVLTSAAMDRFDFFLSTRERNALVQVLVDCSARCWYVSFLGKEDAMVVYVW